MEGRGYNLTVFNMVKIKLKKKSLDEPKIIRRGGVTYSITSTEEIDMPLRYAAYIIDSTMDYGFVPSDKSDLISANGDLLRVVLSLENETTIDAVVNKYFAKKLSKVEAKPEPKVEEKPEPKVEEKVEEKPKPKRKPRATTQSKAEDKPASKRKPRTTKKKEDESPSTPKTKKTKKTTTKEE